MLSWRELFLKQFGKKSKKTWHTAAVDVKLVDKGVKQTLLFDHWSVGGGDMDACLLQAFHNKLTQCRLEVLTVGMDVFVFNKNNSSLPVCTDDVLSLPCMFVDISEQLVAPKTISLHDDLVSETVKVFMEFLSKREDEKTVHCIEVEGSPSINPPCLFGLLLGYPSVYWYNRETSEENCLSGVSLRLYQVQGELRETQYSGVTTHTILSFTIPESVDSGVHKLVHDWFIRWKSCIPWIDMFTSVSLVEEVRQPQAVCL